jgi:hypothetical protein
MPVAVSKSEQVMVLNIIPAAGGWMTVVLAMWFAVTAGNELPIPNFTSAWKDINAKDPALLTALQAGQIVEITDNLRFPANMSATNVEAFLASAWASVNAARNAGPQPGQFYGTYFDGTAWNKA